MTQDIFYKYWIMCNFVVSCKAETQEQQQKPLMEKKLSVSN